MNELTIDTALEKKFTWIDCVKYYWPDKDDDFCDYLLWNETCFPFDGQMTLKQLYKLYTKYNDSR